MDLAQGFVGASHMMRGTCLLAPSILAFPLLRPEACRTLVESARRLGDMESPNTMNRYGLPASALGIDDWLDAVLRQCIAPVAEVMWPDVPVLRKHYSFLVNYQPGRQRSLAKHLDSSLVTLNVCLSPGRGGALRFYDDHGGVCRIAHRVGRAVIHRGDHLHRAEPVTGGHRTNLIIWCRG